MEMPNHVTYEIKKDGKLSIIHHNRMKRYPGNTVDKKNDLDTKKLVRRSKSKSNHLVVSTDESTADSDSEPDTEPNTEPVTEQPANRYPSRTRNQRVVEGAVSWDVIGDLLDE